MIFLFKYLIVTASISISLYADDEEHKPEFSAMTQLQVASPSYSNNPDDYFDSQKNYQKLMYAYHHARTQNAYDNAIRDVYTFVKQHPEDPCSVDLLEGVAIFFPTWEADVNIPLYRKIVQIPNHPKIYKAHLTLYFYGEEVDKDFALWNFKIIADDKTHSCQQDAQEFLDSIGKDWE